MWDIAIKYGNELQYGGNTGGNHRGTWLSRYLKTVWTIMASRNSNLKSNVYQPVAASLFDQLITEKNLDHHYEFISSAKSTIDNKMPKSFKKEIKKRKSSSTRSSRPSSRLSQLSYVSTFGTNGSRFEDESILRNALRLPWKKNEDPLDGLKTSDKMALYIDIMQKNAEKDRLQYMQKSRVTSSKQDIMDSKVFTKPTKSFTPRINAGTKASSKLSQFRCYNPPIRQPKKSAMKRTQANHTENKQTEYSNVHHKQWLNEQAKKAAARQRVYLHATEPSPDSAYNDSINSFNHLDQSICQQSSERSKSPWTDESEEIKYLNFIAEVTDDILSRGIFTNRVLKTVFKSHMQKRSKDLSLPKMEMLLEQLREDLGIPAADSMDEISAGLGSTSLEILSKPSGILDLFSTDDNNAEFNVDIAKVFDDLAIDSVQEKSQKSLIQSDNSSAVRKLSFRTSQKSSQVTNSFENKSDAMSSMKHASDDTSTSTGSEFESESQNELLAEEDS